MMNLKGINQLALEQQKKALHVLENSRIADIWHDAGCRVNIVGSLRMGLLARHCDIDLHVYSRDITSGKSFAIASRIAENPCVTEIKCINGLHTDEHCVAWHFQYRLDDELWQLDVIHIEEGTKYDGFFERMADRIAAIMTPAQRDTILRLKFETPQDRDYHGVEYYEAVVGDGITSLPALEEWVSEHRKKPMYYWIP